MHTAFPKQMPISIRKQIPNEFPNEITLTYFYSGFKSQLFTVGYKQTQSKSKIPNQDRVIRLPDPQQMQIKVKKNKRSREVDRILKSAGIKNKAKNQRYS